MWEDGLRLLQIVTVTGGAVWVVALIRASTQRLGAQIEGLTKTVDDLREWLQGHSNQLQNHERRIGNVEGRLWRSNGRGLEDDS